MRNSNSIRFLCVGGLIWLLWPLLPALSPDPCIITVDAYTALERATMLSCDDAGFGGPNADDLGTGVIISRYGQMNVPETLTLIEHSSTHHGDRWEYMLPDTEIRISVMEYSPIRSLSVTCDRYEKPTEPQRALLQTRKGISLGDGYRDVRKVYGRPPIEGMLKNQTRIVSYYCLDRETRLVWYLRFTFDENDILYRMGSWCSWFY